MAVDFAALKSEVRQVLHDTLAVPAVYREDAAATDVPVNVRWHHKMQAYGDIENEGYQLVLDGVNRLVFHRAEIQELGVTLRAGGVVTITPEGYAPIQLVLSSREQFAGPVDEVWRVGQKA